MDVKLPKADEKLPNFLRFSSPKKLLSKQLDSFQKLFFKEIEKSFR